MSFFILKLKIGRMCKIIRVQQLIKPINHMNMVLCCLTENRTFSPGSNALFYQGTS